MPQALPPGSDSGSSAGSAGGVSHPSSRVPTGASSGDTSASSGAAFSSNDAGSGSRFYDASSGFGSLDAAAGSSLLDGPSGNSSTDAPSDGARTTSSGTSSGAGADAGQGSGTCPNPLGTVWKETEVGAMCTTTWTRQGTTSMFTAVQAAPCKGMATLNVVVSGGNVSAYWTSSNNGNDCDYIGTMSADCSSASGVFSCSSGSGQWSATIQR